MFIWTDVKQSFRIMWCYIIMIAFHYLCFSENHTWSEVFLKFQTEINISKNSRQMNQLSQTIDSTSVTADTTLELMDCQNLTSSHGKFILKIFSCILWSVPYAGPSFQGEHIWCVASETRKGEGREELEGRVHRFSASGVFLTMRRSGLFSIGI